MLKKPTQLTKDGIKNLLEKKFVNSIFQILEMSVLPGKNTTASTTSEKPPEKYKVTISDGYTQFKTFFASDACKMIISGEVKTFSVFELINAVVNITDKAMVIIVKINLLYDNLTDIIGKPMEFDEFKSKNFQNPNGSSVIPQGSSRNFEESKREVPLQNTNKMFGMNSHANNANNNNSAQISNQNAGKAFSLMNRLNGNNNTNSKNAGFHHASTKNHEEDGNLMTIAMLSPVCDPNWRIKARVLKKNDIKQYKNQKGEGCFFTIELMDKNQTEISCSFFNAGCEKWFDFLEEGRMFVFSGGQIKENNSRYNTKNDYQITFDEKATIIRIDEDGTILRQKFLFMKLNEIAGLPLGNMIDLIAIIKDPGECTQITLRSGDLKAKRNLQVYDDSMAAIEITLWGDFATKDFAPDSIIIMKQLKIGEFMSNKNLSSSFSSQIITECEDLPEYQALLGWQQSNNGKDLNLPALTSRSGPSNINFKSLAKLEEESTQKLIDVNEKLFTDVKAFLVFIRNSETTNLYYLSCPTEKCMRKVVEDSDGWRCEKCNKNFPEPVARYIISGKISDDTASIWVSLYDEIANKIIGKSANEIKILKEQGQTDIINNFFKNLQYVQYRMKLMSRMEIYNGESKMKHQILRIYPNEFNTENKNELSKLGSFLKK